SATGPLHLMEGKYKKSVMLFKVVLLIAPKKVSEI
ncbi:MAG: hypothetical protein ACI898_002030, partial [Flavobacteriales bacterium]